MADRAADSEVALEGVILSTEGVNFIDAKGADVLKAIADAVGFYTGRHPLMAASDDEDVPPAPRTEVALETGR